MAEVPRQPGVGRLVAEAVELLQEAPAGAQLAVGRQAGERLGGVDAAAAGRWVVLSRRVSRMTSSTGLPWARARMSK